MKLFKLVTLNLFKHWDKRLVVLAVLAALAIIAVAGGVGWFWWQSNPAGQFGPVSSWPSHTTEINNISFHYPSSMEVIVPVNEKENPVSLVKKGEKGESVLMQVGTWRITPVPQNLADVEKRFEGSKGRVTRSKEHISIGGRDGAVYTQVDAGGRTIVEAFLWDGNEPREISLQLPKTTTQEALWRDTFQDILHSVEFLVATDASANRPKDVPFIWKQYDNASIGFSIWYPSEWHASEQQGTSALPLWRNGGVATLAATFGPTKESDTTRYIVHALPQDKPMTLAALDTLFAQPFRVSAIKGTLSEEHAGLPGVGYGVSLEAKQNVDGKEILTQLLVVVKMPLDVKGLPVNKNASGRAYVVTVLLPDGKAKDWRLEETRLMTRTLKLLP